MFGRDKSASNKKAPLKASLKELLPYLFAQRKLLALALTVGVFSAFTALAQPLLVQQIIERVQSAKTVQTLVVVLVCVLVITAILDGVQHYVLQRMGEGVVLRSRKTLIQKLLFLPISEFDLRRGGDLVSRIGTDTTLLRAVLTQGLVEAMSGMLIFVGALVGMLMLDAMLFFATVLVLALALIVVVIVSARMRPLVTQTQQKVGDLAASVDRAITSIRTIRAAGASAREAQTIVDHAQGAYRLGLRVAKLSAFIVPVSFIALQMSFLVVLGLGGYRVAAGALPVANLVAFLMFVFLLVTPLGQVFGAVSAVNQALGALGRIQDLARLNVETAFDLQNAPAGKLLTLAEVADDSAPQIELDNVHFTYRSAAPERIDAREIVQRRAKQEQYAPDVVETKVLHGVSFSVPRGSRVALVGPSGAGKTTILGLLERFNDPDSGVVRFAGVDVRNLSRDELRAQIGYVEQDAPVLAGTLRDNLLLAAPEASDADCDEVLRRVNLGGVLDRAAEQGGLQTGLDAQVGEHGILLSGGEKQRLAIARALLAKTPVLLLDESTASLDGVNESLMRDAIAQAADKRTLLVIAHRLATVVDSDQIVVLEEGKVIGVGTHSELFERVPLYRELASRQLLAPTN